MENIFKNFTNGLSPKNKRKFIPNLVLVLVLGLVTFITINQTVTQNTNVRSHGQMVTPTGTISTYVTDVSAGDGTHTCALLSDKTIKCWGGNNDYGELGNGTSQNGPNNRPADPVIGIANAIAVDTGYAHSCALLEDSTVKCWGNNAENELGDGTTTSSSVPVTVTGLNNVTAIASGESHNCVLIADGTVKCWGENTYGQLGDGTTTNSALPVTVAGISQATSISAGGSFSCAVLSDKTVKCWGRNIEGELGAAKPANTFTNSTTPLNVMEYDADGNLQILTDAEKISGRGLHACVITTAHGLKCWGWNAYGQLSLGHYTNRNVAEQSTGLTNVIEVSTGRYNTCARLDDASVKCWGDNRYGQLGDGTVQPTKPTTPNQPTTVLTINDAQMISTGYNYNCAIVSGGNLKCWGGNSGGQLGDGTGTNRPTPVYVVGLSAIPNRPPVLNPVDDFTFQAEQTLRANINGYDPDGDAVTLSVTGLPDGAIFDPATGDLTWTPTRQQIGTYPGVTFTITDNGTPSLSDSQTITMTVLEPNLAPVFTPIPDQTVNVNEQLTFTVTATDPEGLPVTIWAESLPNGAVFDPSTGIFTWTPNASQIGYNNAIFYSSTNTQYENQGYLQVDITVNDIPTPTPYPTDTPTPTPTPAQAVNLLSNAGFEANGDWTYNFFSGSGTITRTTNDKHTGKYSYSIKGKDNKSSGQVYSAGHNKIAITSGASYTYSAWHKGINGYLVIKWYDKNGQLLSTSNFSLANSSTWASATVSTSAPAKATTAWLFVQSRYNSSTTYFDDLSFVKTSQSQPQPTTRVTVTPAPTALPTSTPANTPTPAPAKRGLQGTYYNNNNFTGSSTTRTDPTVNFNWGTNPPVSGISANTYSVVWTGYVVPKYSQTYTFYTNTDDGARLWVNGQKLVNDWSSHPAKENKGTITLTAGTKYAIRMEYFQNYGGATAQLSWSSSSQAKQIIPESQLFAN